MKDKEDLKKICLLISFFGLVYVIVNNLSVVFGVLKTILLVLMPFLCGIVIAFILNIPMTKIEKILNKKVKNKSLTRILSITLSLLLLIAVVLLCALLIIPEFARSVEGLIAKVPSIVSSIQTWLLEVLKNYTNIQDDIRNIFADSKMNEFYTSILNIVLNSSVSFITNLISGFVTFFMAIIFAIYMLSQKEYLIRCLKTVLSAFLKPKQVKNLENVGHLVITTFNNFISGQCLEAAILGMLMFIGCSLFHLPYALIIAVLTTLTALIPIFGALFAMLVGAALIAINDPYQAVLFIIIFQVIQQIEGNFIYPRVVGASVGLSPIWTLLAVSVGGSLFGIPGMILGLPSASIFYALFKEIVLVKIKKNAKIEIREKVG